MQIFDVNKHSKVIILEDDMQVHHPHPHPNIPAIARARTRLPRRAPALLWLMQRLSRLCRGDVFDGHQVAPDFFDYFEATAPLLYSDPTLFCVSAWNDNGQRGHVRQPEAIYRTDFFPGLGWMMTRDFWGEVGPKWPKGYWDDWLREPVNRRGRGCLRPDVSRSYTFGEHGSSGGQFFKV